MIDKLKTEIVFEMLSDSDEEEVVAEDEGLDTKGCPDFEIGSFSSDAIMECDKVGAFDYCSKCKWNAG